MLTKKICVPFTVTFGVLTLLVMILILNHPNDKEPFVENYSRVSPSQLPECWLEAVSGKNMEGAFAVSARLTGKPDLTRIKRDYLVLLHRAGFDPRFLGAPFNYVDFQLWQHAFFFKRQADQLLLGEHEDEIKVLFDAVTRRLKHSEEAKGENAWPYEIWSRRYGVSDRQCWVLSELAYQAGYDTQIVIMVNFRTRKSPHTVCEIRSRDGRVWFADPQFNQLLTGKSVEDVALDRKLMQQIWPGKPEFWNTLPNSTFITPAYPQDYCIKNQWLAKKLAAKLGDLCPRFGECPKERLMRYQLMLKGLPEPSPYADRMAYWVYPFQVLAKQLN